MWYLVLFSVVHMYMVFREDIMSGESIISTMVNGIRMFKRVPVGEEGAAMAADRAQARKAA
jgi:Ni/Fe-hydrogenase 1 B-type cytochrome subunit